MSDPTRDDEIKSSFRVSRRGFVKMAGTTAAAAGLAKWAPKAFGQSGETAYPGWEIAPTMPPGVNPYTGIQALLAYNPATDPDAKYWRSTVPLASRAAALTAIQAKPLLSSLPQCVNESYGAIVMGTQQAPLYRYGAQGNVFAYRFFQYQDIVACIQDNMDTGFDGAGVGSTFLNTLPTLTKFIPNAAQIDAAHRNGALALGYIGPNDGSISTGYYFTMQNPDGSYPVGNKMVDLAAYFGFDGWFCDIENTNINAEDFAPVCLAMKARAKALGMPRFYLLDYDNGVSDTGPVQSGAFDCYSPNYGWSSSTAQNDISQVESYGLSPFTTLYFGLDISNNGETDYSQLNSVAPLVIPSDGVAGPPVASIALFTVDAGNGSISSSNTDNANLAASNVYWTNSTGNPALTPASGQNLGIADFITERSAITSFPFVSRFNVGWSSQFFINGSVSNSNPWYSLGIQDILPTWEWWTKDFNSNNIPSGLLSANYDTNAAFNGGSSLQISGNLGANNPTEVRLFKTNLAIPQSSSNYTFSVTYLMVNGSASSLYLGMIFEDNPSSVVWVAAPSGVARGSAGWMQSTLNLSNYTGRTIVAISLGFQGSGSGSPFSICIGEIALLNGATYSGTIASNLTLENSLINSAGTAAQLRLTWRYDPAVWYYDIYRQISGGTMWLGRVSCDCYYVQAMPRIGSESSAVLQLVAVAPDGSTLASDGSTLNFSWTPASGTPTAIVPYIWTAVNGWQNITSITVASGTAVDLGPQPASGGSWSWVGPNGFTSTSREIDNIPLSLGINVYTATYTNSSGVPSRQAFAITVMNGGCTATTITPYIWTAANGWQNIASITVVSGTAVDLGPQPNVSTGWSWTGPNGFTSTSREIDNIPLSPGTNVYTATYTNSSGCPSTQAFTITVTGTQSVVAAINGGGSASGAWVADVDFSGGSTGSTTATINTSKVGNPAPQVVYQTERVGSFTYTIPGLTAGVGYTVNLHFAEIYWTAAGQRIFSVAINGATVLTNFDVFATAGGENIAIVETFAATATSSGTIVIAFNPGSADIPKISGIQITQGQPLQINGGGSASGAWAADEDYSGGSLGSTGATINTSKVGNPAPQAVYQTERVGSFTYTIPSLTAGAGYTVNLHFAEIYWTAAGQRLFNVAINGATVLTNFDIFATAGGENVAIVETFAATATSSGTIVIQFTNGNADLAKISGIQVA